MPSIPSSPTRDTPGKPWWQRVWVWLHQYGSPPVFYDFSRRWQTPSFVLFLLLAIPSIGYGLWMAPEDYLQGDSYRIIYIHVPAAWMSLMIYAFMAAQGAIALIWRVRLCEILISAAAPIGAMFTAVTLLTGMIWGRPTWGTYWTWDARLTSQLVLLFLYLGVMALAAAYADRRQGARAAAVLALIGHDPPDRPRHHRRLDGPAAVGHGLRDQVLLPRRPAVARPHDPGRAGSRQGLGAREAGDRRHRRDGRCGYSERRRAMTEWLLERGHWAFVILAYLVTLILVLADVLLPWLKERGLAREIRALARRTDARSKT